MANPRVPLALAPPPTRGPFHTAAARAAIIAIPGLPGYGVPDGVLNNDDFFSCLALFAAGC